MLVPIETAVSHVKAVPYEEDDLIELYLGAAEQSAVDFLNRQVFATADEMAAAVTAGTAGEDPMVVNKAIEAAILLTLGHLYANREQTVVGATVVEIPFGPRALLRPHRIFPGF